MRELPADEAVYFADAVAIEYQNQARIWLGEGSAQSSRSQHGGAWVSP